MKKRKFIKAVVVLFNRPATKLLFYAAGILLILLLIGTFFGGQSIGKTFLEIITSKDTLTLFFAGLFSLLLVEGLRWVDAYMEESLKIEDNHHKIISQYKAHNNETFDNAAADQFLSIRHVRAKEPVPPPEDADAKARRDYKMALRQWKRESKIPNPIKDNQSQAYLEHERLSQHYLNGHLVLCSTNSFANGNGDTDFRFNDSAKKHELPSFVITHADEILLAHKNSQKANSSTVRLDSFDVEGNTLVFNTSRSTYYHMLITNRCMDYKFANGLSIREIYEYENEICPLERSKLGNQIGINGLVVTSDNYILVEKRGRKKITWKNKFAQSISLAMKLNSLGLDRTDALKDDTETAGKTLKRIIEKTLLDNFGLTPDDYLSYNTRENFLGLARDLLEGGKPNLYFYVKTRHTAKELKELLEENSKAIRNNPDNKNVISSSKLESEYYLIPFHSIEIDYNYRMFLDKRICYKVNRKLYPRCAKHVERWDKAKTSIARFFRPVLVRECGEALLVTIAYMELRDQQIHTHQEKS